MNRCTVRLGLSLLLAMGWWVQRLPAQAPAVAPPPAPAQAPCCGNQDGQPPVPMPSRGVLHRLLNKHGLACAASHDSPTCGSLHSELTFFFGSCRAYFGEPCVVRPPRIPAPAYGH